jgi:hypothetical protein
MSLKVLTLHKGTDSPTSRKNCQFLYPINLYERKKCPITSVPNLVKGDGRLNSRLVAHSLKALLPLLNLVHLVDNTINPNLSRVKVINSSRELVCLRETTKDSNLITNWKGSAREHNTSSTKEEKKNSQILAGDQETRTSLEYTPYTTSLPPRRT